MLHNEPLMAKFRFDTAENELSKAEKSTYSYFGDFDEMVVNKVSKKS